MPSTVQSRFDKYRRLVVKGFAELVLIIVGILGAFAIKDWQDQQKQKKVVADTIEITTAAYQNIKMKYLLKGIASSIDNLWWMERRILEMYDNNFEILAQKYGIKPKKCEA